jgi:carbonic anhydrase/SulP family sulfate permease
LNRDLARQVDATAAAQHPFAVVLSCIDSRAPAELIFDAGVGDIFSARVAGNIVSRKMLGSVEYACAVAGAKLVLVMGHTRCGAVTTAVKLAGSPLPAAQTTGCQNVEPILQEIQESVDPQARASFDRLPPAEQEAYVNHVARDNVLRTVERIMKESETLAHLVHQGRIAIVGAMYDVTSGDIEFLNAAARNA